MYGDGPPELIMPGTHDPCAHEPDPAVFAPVRGSCHVNALARHSRVRSASSSGALVTPSSA